MAAHTSEAETGEYIVYSPAHDVAYSDFNSS